MKYECRLYSIENIKAACIASDMVHKNPSNYIYIYHYCSVLYEIKRCVKCIGFVKRVSLILQN